MLALHPCLGLCFFLSCTQDTTILYLPSCTYSPLKHPLLHYIVRSRHRAQGVAVIVSSCEDCVAAVSSDAWRWQEFEVLTVVNAIGRVLADLLWVGINLDEGGAGDLVLVRGCICWLVDLLGLWKCNGTCCSGLVDIRVTSFVYVIVHKVTVFFHFLDLFLNFLALLFVLILHHVEEKGVKII